MMRAPATYHAIFTEFRDFNVFLLRQEYFPDPVQMPGVSGKPASF
jgi:hypothetical protein